MDNRRKRRQVKRVDTPPSSKLHQYSTRSKGPVEEEDVKWIDDDVDMTSEDSDYDEDEDEDEEESDSEMDIKVNGITIPANIPVSVKIHLHTFAGEGVEFLEEDSEEEDEDSEMDEFLQHLVSKYVDEEKHSRGEQQFVVVPGDKSKNKKKKDDIVPSMKLNRDEKGFFENLSKAKKKLFNGKMDGVAKLLADPEMPFKFKILELPIPDPVKASVIKKIDTINKMGNDSSEAHKLKTWVDAFLRIPFGKQIPLSVNMDNGPEKCSKFLIESRGTLDKAVYGMIPAKTQIMQVLAQWIANPGSVGNVIALKGPMGVGKTIFARNGIAETLKRPFQFFSLGGASDVAHYVGHSYTYEGSMWGRIVDSIIHAGCMNPVLYFDELDKVSGTHQGDEIISMLIHLTDRSQNMQYHDRYFAGIDFDLSQCLFVFSFNDESKVHPVLKDRMNVIECSGYTDDEKKIILRNYVVPELIQRFKFKKDDIEITEDAIKHIIKEYAEGEEGMRSLIRVMETMIMRINLLRISDKNDEATKSLKFFMDVTFPLKIGTTVVEKLMSQIKSVKKDDISFGMYV